MTVPIAVVSVSGGKDSTATATLAIERYGHNRVTLVHADVGAHEHELTRHYIRETLPAALGLPVQIVKTEFSREIAGKRRYIEQHWERKLVAGEALHDDDEDEDAPTRWRYEPISVAEARAIVARALEYLHPTGDPFLDLCLWKGRFPSRKAQFCTQELKRRPLDAFILDRMAEGLSVESWQGVRRDESAWRSTALEYEETPEGWAIRRPIVDWTAQQVVDFCRERGVPLNPLYSQGCDRVGCMVCINSGKNEILNCAIRWPHHVARIREWEALVGRCSRRGVSTLLHNPASRHKDAATAFDLSRIDTMVEWAKTSRGGKQYDLTRFIERTACQSSYGLCE